MKFIVTYDHEVVITYEAIVEAESEEEAREKFEGGDFESETEIEYQGNSMDIQSIEEM